MLNKSIVSRDKQGQQWFLGIYSNNFEDREKDIFTWDSHLEYAKWAKETGVKLPVTVAHQPKYPVEVHMAQFIGLANGTFTAEEFSDNYMKLYAPYAFAQTEHIIPINGFMLVIAKVLKGKEDAVKLLSKRNWGMSHGFLAFDRDENTVDQYRSFEFTTLPLEMAANLLTTSNIKEYFSMDAFKGLDPEDRQALKKLLEAEPDKLEEGLVEMQNILSKVVGSKDLDGPQAEEEVEAEENEETTYENMRKKLFTDFGFEQLNKSFNQLVEMMQTFGVRMDDIEQRLKANEASEDEKIADAWFMPNWNLKSNETENEPNLEDLKEKALGDGPIEGVMPEMDTNNPLYLGWFGPMGLDGQQ